jgi:probable rRNA maturation factor
MAHVEIQNASTADHVPEDEQFRQWAAGALRSPDAELLVRIVDEPESAELNRAYRHKSGPTNVLSFSFEVPEGVPNAFLGDLVICAGVVEREAREQNKNPDAHWAHMVVHGVLHLQGYAHEEDSEAEAMEAEEIAILTRLGFSNPYESNCHEKEAIPS